MSKPITTFVLYNFKEKNYFKGFYHGDICFEKDIVDARKIENLDTFIEDLYDWQVEELFSECIEVKTVLSLPQLSE